MSLVPGGADANATSFGSAGTEPAQQIEHSIRDLVLQTTSSYCRKYLWRGPGIRWPCAKALIPKRLTERQRFCRIRRRSCEEVLPCTKSNIWPWPRRRSWFLLPALPLRGPHCSMIRSRRPSRFWPRASVPQPLSSSGRGNSTPSPGRRWCEHAGELTSAEPCVKAVAVENVIQGGAGPSIE